MDQPGRFKFYHPTNLTMKKVFLMTAIAATCFACSNDANNSAATKDSAANSSNSTSTNAANAPGTGTYNASEGDVTYRDGRVRVWRNNEWVDSDNDVTLDDGVVIRRNGRAVRNGEEVELEDGTVVNKSGRFFDRAGNAIENGWDGLKKGVKKGYNEVKEEVKDATNNNENKNNNQ